MTMVADSYGSTQEAGRPAKVAGTGIGDVIIAADGLLTGHGYGAGHGTTHHAVGTIGLVGHTCVGPRAHHVGARLLALSMVHDL